MAQPCARTSGRTRPELRMTPSERGSQRKQAQVNYSYTHYDTTRLCTRAVRQRTFCPRTPPPSRAHSSPRVSLSLTNSPCCASISVCAQITSSAGAACQRCGSFSLSSRLIPRTLKSHLRPRLRHTSPGIATHRSRNRGTHTIGSTHACLVTSATVRPASSRAPGGISAAAPK